MLQKHFHIGTCNADKCEAEEDVRCHPSPVGVPAVKQCQDETEPDPVKWDGPALCVTRKEEERRSGQASDNAPPLVVFHKKIADMANRSRNDCSAFQPVGVVYALRSAPPNAWPHACLQLTVVLVERYLGLSTNAASLFAGEGVMVRGRTNIEATTLVNHGCKRTRQSYSS